MKREKISEAIGNISGRHIEEAAVIRTKRSAIPKWAALTAACLSVVIIITAITLPAFLKKPHHEIPTPPVYENTYLSASDVDKMLQMRYEGGATSSYTKIYCRHGDTPKYDSIPKDENVYIYKRLNEQTVPLDMAELSKLSDSVMPKLALTMDIDLSNYEKKESESDLGLNIRYRHEQHPEKSLWSFNFHQYSNGRASFYTSISDDTPLTLGGREVTVDQRQSEMKILRSLAWARDILFEVFGRSFDSAEVVFGCSDSHRYGVGSIYVYYYNKAEGHIQGDYIMLEFDNTLNYSGELTVSPDIIKNCSISYVYNTVPLSDKYSLEAECRRISLEEAEALAANGYVFGGHVCPICMAAQEKISFAEYDYVGFTYMGGNNGGKGLLLPFYVFYKKLGRAENGVDIYAMTYVCAIELSGYVEYFESQAKDHSNRQP